MIVDAHLDLAYNALGYDRDLLLPLEQLRHQEGQRPLAGRATVTFPELQKAGVGLIFGTLFASPAHFDLFDLHQPITYRNQAEAQQQAMRQLDYYRRLADEHNHFRIIGDLAGLDAFINEYRFAPPPAAEEDEENTSQSPISNLIGIVPLMEGADPIREPEELEMWWEQGLRIIGPAWDDTRYAPGAWREGGSLPKEGHHLLEVMADYGFILDITHMSEKASLQALERYEATAVATHSNARALVPGQRQLSDTQIRLIGERNGIIGTVLFNPFLIPNYPKKRKDLVTLDHVVAHIDHVCQALGNADHVGIGSDFDGGFGANDIPAEMDSAADLPLIATKLHEKGYEDSHINAIMGENWLNLLRRAW